MHITLYRGAFAKVPAAQTDFDTWDDAVFALSELVQQESSAPLGADREEQKRNMFAFAPHRLSVPVRKLENVDAVTLMVIDVDRCNADALAEKIDALRTPAFMYASPSDDRRQPDARRVRVIAPVSREITVAECRKTRQAFAELLGLEPGCGVEGAIDAAKLFFIGRLHGTPNRQTWLWK